MNWTTTFAAHGMSSSGVTAPSLQNAIARHALGSACTDAAAATTGTGHDSAERARGCTRGFGSRRAPPAVDLDAVARDEARFVARQKGDQLPRQGRAAGKHRVDRTERTQRFGSGPLASANKQNLPNAMTVAEVTEKLGVHSMWNRQWVTQSACFTTSDGLHKSLDWLSRTLAAKKK